MEKEGSQFLQDKYQDLANSKPVERAVAKAQNAGELVPDESGKIKKRDQIGAYIDRLEKVSSETWTDSKGVERSGHFGLIKNKILANFTINLKNEDGSEDTQKIDKLILGLFESEKEILRRRGLGEELENYGDHPREEDYERYKQQIYEKKAEQEKTLGNWVDYLASSEANFYPTWFKYFALRSLQKMGKRNRDTLDYSTRSDDTLHPFPDLSYEALALTLDALQRKLGPEFQSTQERLRQIKNKIKELNGRRHRGEEVDEVEIENYQQEIQALTEKQKEILTGGNLEQETGSLETALHETDFAKLYAYFQNQIEVAKRERTDATAGQWRHFPNGSDPQVLCATLAGKGTEWCTAGLDVARGQLESGEFYIYYTYDQNNQPTDPRVAIFLIKGEISEVRGVYGKDQDLELNFVDIAHEKYKEFPGSERYEKKDHDMKLLSSIEDKINNSQDLTKDDLLFLYEINSTIEGFGHYGDPRVEELRNQRNIEQDLPIIFECEADQITHNVDQINEQTRAYVGQWSMDAYRKVKQFPALDRRNLYESFPSKKIFFRELDISPDNLIKNKAQAMESLKSNDIKMRDYVESMMIEKIQFTSEVGEREFVGFSVDNLFQDGRVHTINEIYQRAQELELELCLGEDAIYTRLEYEDQSLDKYIWVAMEPITDSRGNPHIFGLRRSDGGRWLYVSWYRPGYEWNPGSEFVFRSSKVENT
jgi:hypothetical protein